MGRDVNTVYIADGFADDCEELIHRCSRVQPLGYPLFAQIWKDMNMAGIYKDRTSGAEIAELSEEVIHIAKHYMLTDSTNYEESVAGLFLVYALVNLQPYPNFAWLRLVPEDVPAIRRIEIVARRERRMDVLRILGDVLVRSSQYVATVRERGIEVGLRKYFGGTTSIDRHGVRPKGVFQRQSEEQDLLRELDSLLRFYGEANTHIGGARDRNLRYVDHAVCRQLNSSLRAIINGVADDDTTPCHSDAVQAIKARAMQSDVGGVAHLTGVHERAKSSPKKKEATVTKAEKSLENADDRAIVLPRTQDKCSKKRSHAKQDQDKTFDVPIIDDDIAYIDMPVFSDDILRPNAAKIRRAKKKQLSNEATEKQSKEDSNKVFEVEILEANDNLNNVDEDEGNESIEDIEFRHVSPKKKPTEKQFVDKAVFNKPRSENLVVLKRMPKKDPERKHTTVKRKRKSSLKKNSKIKRRKSYSSSSESDLDVDMSLLDSDEDTYSVTDDIDKAIDLDIDNCIQGHIIDNDPPEPSEIVPDIQSETPNVNTDNVDNESLIDEETINERLKEGKPLLIHAENDGQIIEIEIIDQMTQTEEPNGKTRNLRSMNSSPNKTSAIDTSNIIKKLDQQTRKLNKQNSCKNKVSKRRAKKNEQNGVSLGNDVTIQIVNQNNTKSPKKNSNASPRRSPRTQNMAVITKVENKKNKEDEEINTSRQNGGKKAKNVLKRLKTPDKRDMKNSKVKSTLRRMGILPVVET